MKKVLSLLVVLSMIASALPVVSAHWAEGDVSYLVENGAIAEDDAMLQNLDTPITRSQMVKVIVALLEGDEPIEGKEYFTDITLDDTHIAKAAENGIVNGFGDGTFRPNNPITRQDFFTIVGRAYKLEGEATSEFTDANIVADYAKPYVDALQSIGIVNGYGDGTVNPRGNITIAETLAVMHRTDEHVKANTPKAEEKPKPSGGSGGGGGGGFSGSGVTSPNLSAVSFTVELAEDYSSGVVAYITPNLPDHFASMPKVFVRGNKNTCYSPTYAGGYASSMYVVTRHDLDIPENNGTYAVPDFGTYSLCLYDSILQDWRKFEVTVVPPKSEDTVPPALTVEIPEETHIPFEVKVSASDDNELVRLNYVRAGSVTSSYAEKARHYKANPNDRKDIINGSFIVEGTNYIICAMDASGNCAYAEIKVDYYGLVINYEEESISEYFDDEDTNNSGDTYNGPNPTATFDIEFAEDYSGEIVAYATAKVKTYNNTIVRKTMLLRDGGYSITAQAGGNPTKQDLAEEFGQYISEENGRFALPDFGNYELHIIDSMGNLGICPFTVYPPQSDDTTAPELNIEVVGDANNPTYPLTFKVTATDNVGIAKISYLKETGLESSSSHLENDYKVNVNGRQIITGDTITIDNPSRYTFCAMDVNGHCAYRQVDAFNRVSITDCKYGYSFDNIVPGISASYSTDTTAGPLKITLNISDNAGVVESGYFHMDEYYEPEKYNPFLYIAWTTPRWQIDLSQSIEDLLQYEDMCGGDGSIHLLKNYYEAVKEDSNIEINPINDSSIIATKNGAYFIYAKDEIGNLTVRRIYIYNINAES